MKRIPVTMWMLLLAALATSTTAHAQPYPQQPIRLIVAFGPGSGADAMARVIAERLALQLKTGVTVENREGAGGLIGASMVAKAPADGYTLHFGVTSMTVSPHLQAVPAFDPVKDFVPIVKVAELALLMITGNDAPYKSLKELIAYAKKNPGKLNYATSGKGSPSHLGVEMIRKATGIDVRDVPYKNIGQATTDVIGGQVSFYFPGITGAAPQVKAGKARGLAVGSVRRSALAPEVPTVAEETGIAGLEVITWYGLLGPAGLPREIASRLQAETFKALEVAEVRERIVRTGAEVVIASGEEFAAQIRGDSARYEKLVRELGLRE